MAWGNGDFFVDSSAVGLGDGTSPANAAINITSLWSTITSANFGANVWVRRNHWTDISDTRSASYGPAASILGSTNVNSHPYGWTIGWPNSGDPFYEERPVSAVSAGWDASTSLTFMWPTLVLSGSPTSSNGIRRHCGLTNFTVIQSGGNVGQAIITDFFGSSTFSHLGWVGIGTPLGAGTSRDCEHVVLCITAGSGVHFINADACRKITIAASCMLASNITAGFGALYKLAGGQRNEEIVNLSNSISVLFELADANVRIGASIGRVRGIRPYSMDVNPTGAGQYATLHIDDYFGAPAIFRSRNQGISGYLVSSPGVAVYSGSTAFRTASDSYGTAISVGNIYGQFENHFAPVRQNIQVTSGVPLTIRLPIAVTNVGTFDYIIRGTGRVHVPAAGCGERKFSLANSGIQPGSSGLWTGSMTGVQSYYQLFASFTPQETAVVPLALRLPGQSNIGSGAAIYYPPYVEVGST